MDIITELIKIIVPAGLVLYAMFLVVRSFLNKQFDSRLIDLKLKNTETILPIRLQAYERVALLLERISPNNMLIRLSDPQIPAMEFQQVLLKEIQEELNHNLSQQVYMSDEVWQEARKAINEIIAAIQAAAERTDANKTAIDLSEAIFNEMLKKPDDPIGKALRLLKNEVRQLM